MKLLTYILIALLSLSCGQSRSPKAVTQSISVELQAEIDRMTPLLKYDSYGLPIEEPYDGPSSGDAMSMNGRTMLDSAGTIGSFPAVLDSILPNGHPYRNPLQAQQQDPLASFSRDALMGLIEASVSVKDFSALLKVRDYYKENGRMCDNEEEARCYVTPSMNLLVDEVTGNSINLARRVLDEATITTEASTAPATYGSYLVMRKLRLHIETDNLTSGYVTAIRILHERYPNHLYASYLYVKSVKGDLQPIAEKVLACMKTWEGPGEDWWGKYFDGCPPNPQGHELVSFAMLLIRESAQ